MAKFISYMDGGKTDEKGISQHLAGLFKGEVINGLAVTQDSPLGMSVLVSKGRCMIDSADDYPYLGFTDANEVVTITAADGSNPRIDAIVAYVDLSVVDSTNANNPGAFEIVAVAGTPAGSPNPPNDGAISTAIGLGNPFIRLAHVTVGAGATTITTGNVSDQRVSVGLPDGFIRSSDTLGQSVVEKGNVNFDSGIWWEEIGRTTLSTAGDVMTITDIPQRKFLQIHVSGIPTGGDVSALLRFNNDSGNNYARRSSDNFGASGDSASRGNLDLLATDTGTHFYSTIDVINISNLIKICTISTVQQGNSVAAGAPGAKDSRGKWVNTSAPINRVDVVNAAAGDFAIGSEVVVLGHN